ncbi:MAG: FliA/WhiG family RNA polymerase sigma factor [Desulfuromonadaceae bacterium]|nr:FliA/WhiG family RNA polymerase sigma factor [Desulfuromonas sp.]MDY0185009.1 FliA/WhiG family RNA polymerase sigma factor [Desulfuromonadaceae bacterium]
MSSAYGIYSNTASPEVSLARDHMPLARLVVERMKTQVPGFVTRDDMMSAAMEGLMDAASRFDPERGVMFKTFAERRIRGAIYDEVRKMDWFSRSLRGKQSRISRAIELLEHRYGRSPEEDEVAAELELSLEEYLQMLSQVGHLGCVSLNEVLDEQDETRNFMDLLKDDSPSAHESLEHSALAQQLASHLEALTEKERQVVSLYYYEELTQKEISEVLELTEGRISQLHSQALVKLRAKLARDTDF